MKERRNRIIVVLIGDGLPRKMDSKLKSYIKTTSYIRSTDPQFWDKLRRALPDVELERNDVEIDQFELLEDV